MFFTQKIFYFVKPDRVKKRMKIFCGLKPELLYMVWLKANKLLDVVESLTFT